MIKACILGGGGFIGTALARELAAHGHQVRIFGHPPRFPQALGDIEVLVGSLHQRDLLYKAISDQDLVFHLVGNSTPATADKDRAEDLRQNVERSLALFEAAREGVFGRIVFISSGGTVYGPQKAEPIPEDAPQWPISAYGVAKVTLERYLHLYHHLHGVDYRIARISNPFGDYQLAIKGQGLIAAALMKGLTNQPIPMVGDGSVVRDYVHVADVGTALRKLGQYDGPERIFNIGSGVGRSVRQILDAVEVALGHSLTIENLPNRAFDVPVNILDISRARRELDWTPDVDFHAGLTQAANWMRSYLRERQSC